MIRLQLTSRGPRRGDLLAVGVFSSDPPATGSLPAPVAQEIARFRSPKGFRGARGQTAQHTLPGKLGGAVRLYGLGDRDSFDADRLVGWFAQSAKEAGRDGFATVHLVVPEVDVAAERSTALRAQVALLLADYRFESFRKPSSGRPVSTVRLTVGDDVRAAFRATSKWAAGIAEGTRLARDLGNTPPNEATPAWMADQCRSLGRDFEMKTQVLTPSALERRKMGGILAVGGGSANPPRLVRMEWGAKRGPIVSFVGKGVTFDTGGISIKPAASMHEMKYDKCGACAVIGIVRATAELGLPFRFRAYLPFAENMPDGHAYRPGDIVRCHNGKTVEIINTDAEGRMILADALSWAASEGPDTMLEYSTLTGSAVAALGQTAAALYTPDNDLAEGLLGSAAGAGERLWRMPLWPEYSRAVKGVHSDLKNLGARWGGANHAAAFLSEFVGSMERWAHMDVAGPAYVTTGPSEGKGATGYGVALTVAWLLAQSGKLD